MTTITTPTEKPKPLITSVHEYNLIKEFMLELHTDPNYDIYVIIFLQKALLEWAESNPHLVD